MLTLLIHYFRQAVLQDGLIGTADTRVTLLLPKTIPKVIEDDPKSARIHEVPSEALREAKPSVSARMWAYRGMTVALNVFDFTVRRQRDPRICSWTPLRAR